MRLQYEIAVDARQIKTVLRGVGAEFTRSERAARQTAAPRARAKASDEEKAARQAEQYWQRAAQRSTDYRMRQDEKAHRARERQIAKEDALERRAVERSRRDRERADARRVATGRSVARGAARSVGGGARTVLGFGGAALGIAGGLAIGNALTERVNLGRQAAVLANTAGDPGAKGRLLSQAGNIVGVTEGQKLGGLQAFVGETGNLATGDKVASKMGQLSRVFGVDFEKMMKAAGQTFNSLALTIEDPVKRMTELDRVMTGFAAQSAMGSIEIEDLTGILGALGATAQQFSGNISDNLLEIGALAQLTKRQGGADSAAEAATALSRVPKDVIQNRERFKALGIDLRDKESGKLVGTTELLARTFEKTKGDRFAIAPLFNIESAKAVESLRGVFFEAEKKEKGSGRAAIFRARDEFKSAGFKPGELAAMDASVTGEASTQLTEVSKRFNEAVGTQLLPVVIKAIPEFARMIPTLTKATEATAKFATFMMDNPVKGIGAIIAAKVAADMAASGISNAVSSGIGNLFKGGMGAGALKLGAITLAATSVLIAADQATSLAKESGGWEGVWAGIKSTFSEGSFFAGVDRHMNEQALARARDPFSPENREKGGLLAAGQPPPGTPAVTTAPAAGAATPQTVTGSAPVADQKLALAAAALQDAAIALKSAAPGALGPSDPVRNTPNNRR